MQSRDGLASSRRSLPVRGLQPAHVCYRWDDFRPNPHSPDRVVRSVLAVRYRQGRDLGTEPPANAEIGSYQTAWAMLHRFRSVLVRPGRERLAGVVEVDETFIGGLEPGLAGGRARGKKVLTGIAVEIHEPKGIGRCRMLPLADASSDALHPFVRDHVEPGARVITDGWQGYRGLETLGYVHDRRSQRASSARGDDPHQLLPAVHRVASLAKRWLLGTHQGSVKDTHLVSYLNEFVFRFNRRRSRSRGMVFFRVLELAVAHKPVRYEDLVVKKRPRVSPAAPPGPGVRSGPPSLDRPDAGRPWRRT